MLRSRKTKPPRTVGRSGVILGPALGGVPVTARTALGYTPVYRAVDLIATGVAGLPRPVVRGQGTDGRTPLPNHRVSRLLNRMPNTEQTPFMFFEALTGHLATWGNGYAEIQRNGRGEPDALWPLPPDRMEIKRDDDTRELYYEYRVDTQDAVRLAPANIIHIALRGDGIKGISPIAAARQAIGLGLAAESFGATFFGNSSRPSGVYTHPQKLSDQAHRNLRRDLEAMYQGPVNAHRLAILEEGLTWQQVGVPPEDAQFLETRTFQVQEIARMYGIPPHKLGELSRATFNNIEEQNIEWAAALGIWILRWEEELNRKLLGVNTDLSVKFNLNALLRADIVKRTKGYATGRQWGWYSVNDVRRLEDLNPLPPEQGDVYLSPANMLPVEDLGKTKEDDSAFQPIAPATVDDEETNANRLRPAFRKMFRDAAGRLVHKEVASLRRIVGRCGDDGTKLEESMQKFYRGYEVDALAALGPVWEGWMEATGNVVDVTAECSRISQDAQTTFIDGYVGESEARVASLLDIWAKEKADYLTQTYFGSDDDADVTVSGRNDLGNE